jgi:hypothetical protein
MISDCVPIDRAKDLTRLPAHLAASLQDLSAKAIRVDGTEVFFSGGLFRMVGRGNLLAPFGSGVLKVDPDKCCLCFQLRVRQLALVATALAALLALLVAAGGHWEDAPKIAVFVWFWLVGGNLLIGIPRFRFFLRKTLASAPVTARARG